MPAQSQAADQLLTVEEAAERMRAKSRFIRRLIAERRIEYVKVGRHVRISEPALAAFIAAGRVQPMTPADVWPQIRPVRDGQQAGSSPSRQCPAASVGPVSDPVSGT